MHRSVEEYSLTQHLQQQRSLKVLCTEDRRCKARHGPQAMSKPNRNIKHSPLVREKGSYRIPQTFGAKPLCGADSLRLSARPQRAALKLKSSEKRSPPNEVAVPVPGGYSFPAGPPLRIPARHIFCPGQSPSGQCRRDINVRDDVW